MRPHEILGMIKRYFSLGLIGVIALGILWGIGYYIIYGKVLDGKKKFTKIQLLVGTMLTGYIIMVIGVTFLNRGSHFQGRVNLHLLSSYREAWNKFSISDWQFIILNILMLVPLGILLPILHPNFKKIRWTMGAGLIFTLLIECLQFATGFGIFELDDIFNNIIGTLIGYSIVMGIITLLKPQKHKFLKSISCLVPSLLVLAVFFGMFSSYDAQEFGNLAVAYNYKINMKNIETTSDIELNKERLEVPIYSAHSYTRESGKDFAINVFNNLEMDTSNLEMDAYNDNAIYWTRESHSNIWLRYLDGSYSFTDFTSFDDGVEPVIVDEKVVLEALSAFDINIPKEAIFKISDRDEYQWTVRRNIVGDTLTEGSISCEYYNDGTIKRISNNLITYYKIRDVSIKSEIEAYEELMEGKFQIFNSDTIKSIHILGVELDYKLDSKGFYQPVYLFNCLINGGESTVIIAGLE